MSAPTLAALAPVNAAPALDPAAAAAGPAALQEPANPLEAQRFAQLLSASPQPVASHGATGSGSLLEAAQAISQDLGGTRSLQDMRSSMLASVDLRDPIGTMFALTDHSLEAHAMFARLHISSGLAGAATNLFGTLLKNQQ
jgi:hypothetical protein